MIYKFNFKQKPFNYALCGQVETDNFFKWFAENAPFGVRLIGKPEELKELEGGLNNFTKSFKPQDYFERIDPESCEKDND
jgi:hypothetical protein